ncbi:MAG: hypothetical protein MJB14_15590 [Spirochaetes bacterium]|nr:hypothetical protein [Spirochaetota bacterium]
MENSLNFLSSRSGFNTALRHFKSVNGFIKAVSRQNNLADVINNALEYKKIQPFQISPILGALLVDKFQYYTKSFSIKKTYPGKLSEIASVMGNWNKFDLVVSYFHPQLGQIVINPKNPESWEAIDSLKETELVVCYVGNYNGEFDLTLAKKCGQAMEIIINGGKISDTKEFQGASRARPIKVPEKKVKTKPVQTKAAQPAPTGPKPAPQPKSTPPTGKKKISPRYGVLVANELFHNGNVEAWKKIIMSYQTKYPHIQVLVFYEGEQIHDINTLFKWGKVKHGTNIYFSLLGPEFKDISKLRRYLAQGASHRFEDFLKGDPTKVLSLF